MDWPDFVVCCGNKDPDPQQEHASERALTLWVHVQSIAATDPWDGSVLNAIMQVLQYN